MIKFYTLGTEFLSVKDLYNLKLSKGILYVSKNAFEAIRDNYGGFIPLSSDEFSIGSDKLSISPDANDEYVKVKISYAIDEDNYMIFYPTIKSYSEKCCELMNKQNKQGDKKWNGIN